MNYFYFNYSQASEEKKMCERLLFTKETEDSSDRFLALMRCWQIFGEAFKYTANKSHHSIMYMIKCIILYVKIKQSLNSTV